jgi:hypothetical protein
MDWRILRIREGKGVVAKRLKWIMILFSERLNWMDEIA